MVSSYTTNKAFDKPANGDYVDTWNIPVNADWDIADKAFGGTHSISLTNANVTLTQTNCQNVRIRCTGSLSGNIIIYFPAGVSGFFIVQNATTGTYSVTLASAGGGAGTVLTEQGRTAFVFTEGTNVFYADDSRIQLTAGNGIAITGTTNLTISLVTPVTVADGGTGLSSYVVGDLIYASGATTLAKLPDVATGNALISGGVTTAPLWGKIGLTTHITGTLAIGNGGTGQTTAAAAFDGLAPTTTRGDLIVRNATTNVRFAIGSANTVLLSNGTDPAWGQVSLTAAVTGTLPIANGGTAATTAGGARTSLSAAWTGQQIIAGSGLTGGGDLSADRTLAVATGGITSTMLASGVAVANIGYTPVNKAGDTMTGALTATQLSDSSGNLRSVPQNAKSAPYTLIASDNGKHISITTGGVTVPASVFSVGDNVTIFNNSSSSQTITQGGSVTLRQAATTNTGNRSLAGYGVCTILCVASNTFVVTGNGVS